LRVSARSILIIPVLCFALEGAAAASPSACPLTDAQGACFETCELQAGPEVRASDLFQTKLRTIAPTGRHIGGKPGPAVAKSVSQFRVASIPFNKDEAARWRQNGLWAGPCAGLSAVFEASAIDNKDASNVVDLFELHYTSDAGARRVAALLGTSWDWNGHPFITIQRGTTVIVAEGRYGAWSALETVGAHFGGAVYPRGAPIALRVCDKGSRSQPIFQGDGLTVHVLGFAPSGELAWLEGRGGPAGATAWSMHVSNLVNDREIAARSYRAVGPTAEAFCAEHRTDAGALLSEHGVTGGEITAFDKPTIDGAPVSVLIQAGSSGKQIVMQGPAGTKVIGRVPAGAGAAKPLGFIRSPFEERVAVLVLVKDAASGRSGLRVLGGRLDKRWMPRQ
jgi:hypothetical protein